jgi:hypothetical protein
MRDVKTVDNPPISITDPLIAKQQEDVAKMRTSLLCCNGDPYSISQTIQKVTAMRVYHQVTRIVKYLDTMDRIEEKLYESIDYRLDTIDVTNSMSWATLLRLQEQLQKNMIESQKLLDPYLNNKNYFIDEVQVVQEAPDGASILSKSSRDKLRTSAQQVLAILGPIEVSESEGGDSSD